MKVKLGHLFIYQLFLSKLYMNANIILFQLDLDVKFPLFAFLQFLSDLKTKKQYQNILCFKSLQNI